MNQGERDANLALGVMVACVVLAFVLMIAS